MPTRSDQTPSTDRCPIQPRPTDTDRYVALPMNGVVLIFDRTVETAWLKSDVAIELESME